MRYDDHLHSVNGQIVPRVGRDGLVICGWCGYRVNPVHTAPDAPWLCEDCGMSRAAAHRQAACLRATHRQA